MNEKIKKINKILSLAFAIAVKETERKKVSDLLDRDYYIDQDILNLVQACNESVELFEIEKIEELERGI